MQNKKVMHGNKAKVTNKKDVIPKYQTYPMTNFVNEDGETPTVSDENVIISRNFVNENEK